MTSGGGVPLVAYSENALEGLGHPWWVRSALFGRDPLPQASVWPTRFWSRVGGSVQWFPRRPFRANVSI